MKNLKEEKRKAEERGLFEKAEERVAGGARKTRAARECSGRRQREQVVATQLNQTPDERLGKKHTRAPSKQRAPHSHSPALSPRLRGPQTHAPSVSLCPAMQAALGSAGEFV